MLRYVDLLKTFILRYYKSIINVFCSIGFPSFGHNVAQILICFLYNVRMLNQAPVVHYQLLNRMFDELFPMRFANLRRLNKTFKCV